MKKIVVSGVCGGAGSTTVVANLAAALQAAGQRTLSIDLNPSNLLALQFGVDPHSCLGWANSWLDGGDWSAAAMACSDGRRILPFGKLVAPALKKLLLALEAEPRSLWQDLLRISSTEFDYVLFDTPPAMTAAEAYSSHRYLSPILANANAILYVANPNVAAYTLLTLHPLWQSCWSTGHHLLLNRTSAAQPLSSDMSQLMHREFTAVTVPVSIASDSHIPEAAAHMTSVLETAADCQAARDFAALAMWCLSRD